MLQRCFSRSQGVSTAQYPCFRLLSVSMHPSHVNAELRASSTAPHDMPSHWISPNDPFHHLLAIPDEDLSCARMLIMQPKNPIHLPERPDLEETGLNHGDTKQESSFAAHTQICPCRGRPAIRLCYHTSICEENFCHVFRLCTRRKMSRCLNVSQDGTMEREIQVRSIKCSIKLSSSLFLFVHLPVSTAPHSSLSLSL